MNRRRRFSFMLIFFPVMAFCQSGSFLNTEAAEVSVKLATHVEPGHVPLNREVTLTVQISWRGDQDRILIEEIEEPLLSRLEITGTASANHVLGGPGGSTSVREILYTLKPTDIGMAYIESVGLRYQDTITGESSFLRTEQIGIEVLPSVRDKSATRFPGWIVIAAVAALSFIGWLIRRIRSAGPRPETEDTGEIMEERYLTEMKDSISLKEGDRTQAFVALSKLFRRYLAEKFDLAAMEATTASLLQQLRNLELDEALILKCETFFGEADVIKFSGEKATPSALETAYTTVETVLEAFRDDAVLEGKAEDK